jgi:hypothetical protein
MALRAVHDTLNFLGRRRHRGVRRHDHVIGQLPAQGALLPPIICGDRQSQISENRCETARRTELLRTGKGRQDGRLFVCRVTPARRYRQRPFLSCRFSALSSAMTACSRCTSARSCSSAGRTFFRPRGWPFKTFKAA